MFKWHFSNRIGLMLYIVLSAAILACLNIDFAFAESSSSEKGPANDQQMRTDQAIGISLEGVPYPYPIHFIDVMMEGQEIRMAYMDVKPEQQSNGKAVILIHGKNFYGSYWANVISYLVNKGYRVIAPDQIGFGKSAKPDIHYNFDSMAKSNIDLLNHLAIEKAIVLGHSMGGMLAVRFVRLYPDRTEKLILENPVGLEDYRINIPPVPLEKLIKNELQQTNESIRSFMKRYVMKWDPQIYEPFVDIRTRIMGSAEFPKWAKSSALSSRMMYEQPVLYEFPYVKAPTLLVIGQNDRTIAGRAFAPKNAQESMGFYPELGRKAAKSFPNATLVELENVGHIPHLEAPDRFLEAIGKFINE